MKVPLARAISLPAESESFDFGDEQTPRTVDDSPDGRNLPFRNRPQQVGVNDAVSMNTSGTSELTAKNAASSSALK